MKKIVIIGGMAAGCKAAARLSRLSPDYQITVIERKPFVSFDNCGLPLYASGDVNDLFDLSKTAYGVIRDKDYFRDAKDVDVLINTEAEEIDAEELEVRCKDIEKNKIFSLPYDALIIATGTKPVEPKFPLPKSQRISSFHHPFDAKAFREEAQKGKVGKAVIIGGGFVGCELTDTLSSLWGIETTLIETENSLMINSVDPEISRLIEKRIIDNGVKILSSTEIEKIELDQDDLPVVYPKDGRKITSDYVFYNLGVKPETTLARSANVKLGKYGGIVVDKNMRTNINNIWAAGNCVETVKLVTSKAGYFPLGSISNRMGRVAADSIAGLSNEECVNKFKGAVGTISLKIFDQIICAAGLTEREANKSGYNIGSVIGCWADRPDYHPDSKNIFGKLVFEKDSLKLLGLQLLSEGEVTRYIDTFSELLTNKRTVYDLVNLEHAYAPAHSSPISPLNYLGYMAVSQEKDGIKNFNPLCLSSFKGIFIDVREPSEVDYTPFQGNTIHIPFSRLRLKLGELEHMQPYMFLCSKGPRSYEAARLLINNGFKNISYLGGGMVMYKEITRELKHKVINDNVKTPN